MKDFLPQLQRLQRPIAKDTGTAGKKDVLFMLDNTDGEVKLRTVDAKLQPFQPNHRYYSDITAQLLHQMEKLRDEMAFEVTWGEESADDILPANHPHLMVLLTKCSNVVDATGKPIAFVNEPTTLMLHLERSGNTLKPRLALDSTDAALDKATMLTDSHLLADNNVYTVQPIGDNFKQLPHFLAPFDTSMLEQWLSVFYTYVEGVQVVYEDYTVCMADEAVKPQPTLLFEKVDVEKTLFLRLVESIKGLPIDFAQQFDLSFVASLSSDHRITLRRIAQREGDSSVETLLKRILQYAPSREARKQVYQEDNLFIIPEDTAAPFLMGALPTLLAEYQLVGAEKLREYKVKAAMPKLNVSLSSGIDFLEGDARLEVGGEEFTLQDIFRQYASKKYIQLSDGNRAIIDDGYMRKLGRIFERKKDKDGRIKVSFFDLPEVEELINGPLEGEAFKHHREVYEGFNALKKEKLPKLNVQATLRPYQCEGIKWMKYLYDNRLGGCLADDMGLGKTLQTIGVLVQIYPAEKQPTLIVMPRSLLFNWRAEIEKFAPQLSVYTYYAGERNMEEARKHQVILTTYAIVRNDIEQFKDEQFHYVILDESQSIKNIATQNAQAVMLLHADHRLALSGTPIENHLGDLYSLFRFLNPTMFGTADDFNRRYASPIQKDNDKDALVSLRRKIYPFMLRRLKKDVLKDLPDRIEQTLYVEMDGAQASFYEKRRQYYFQQVRQTIAAEGLQKSQFVMFQALSELRRIASVPESLSDGRIHSPKLDQLADTLLEAVANGHKCVVFFNFIAGLELMGERLEAEGIDYASMTGSTRDRQSVVERFQGDPKCMVMLMTLKTGGVGLNLTAADTVFIFEPWWNKAAEAQAINRLHRFGQKAKVLSYSLITQATIEEKIQLLQQKKQDLFDGLISSDSTAGKQLTEEDINFILG